VAPAPAVHACLLERCGDGVSTGGTEVTSESRSLRTSRTVVAKAAWSDTSERARVYRQGPAAREEPTVHGLAAVVGYAWRLPSTAGRTVLCGGELAAVSTAVTMQQSASFMVKTVRCGRELTSASAVSPVQHPARMVIQTV
jgi:hypothetical protein